MPLRVVLQTIVLVGTYLLISLASIVGAASGRYSFLVSILLSMTGVLLICLGLFALWIFVPQCDRFLLGLKKRWKVKTIALTFDDGPREPWTSEVLDILKTHHVPATFFLVGNAAKEHGRLLRRMKEEGHAIGNHTVTHRRLPLTSTRRLKQEIDECNRILAAHTGRTPRLFRAPHGFRHPKLQSILKERSMINIPWTRGVWDTDQPSATTIIRRALSRPRTLEILLLHDGTDGKPGASRASMIEALPEIITSFQRMGYAFTTIDALVGVS